MLYLSSNYYLNPMRYLMILLILPLIIFTGCWQKKSTTQPAPTVSSFEGVEIQKDRISIKSATFAQSGFLILFDQMSNGQPGNVYGIGRLLPYGTYSDLVIPILKPVEAGKTYLVQLIKDNGDLVYTRTEDQVVVDSQNSPLQKTIVAP